VYIGNGFIRSQLVLLFPSRYSLIDCRLCWLVLWECGWANPRFKLPVKDGGWLRVLFARLHKLSLLAASYPAVLQLVIDVLPTSWRSGQRVALSGIKAFVTTVGILSIATYIFLFRPIHQQARKIYCLDLSFNLLF